MRILVTGSGGFIGMHLLGEITHHFGSAVEVLTWSGRRQGDLRVPGVLESKVRAIKPDAVVQLAWSPTSVPDYAMKPENALWLDVGLRLAKLSQELGFWVLFAGSAADELSEDTFKTPYGNAKRNLRTVVLNQGRNGLCTWFRPQYVYSVEYRRPALLRQTFAEEGKDAFTPDRPDDLRDWIDVRDVATGITAILANRILGVVDLGSGKAHTVQQFLTAVRLNEIRDASKTDLSLWQSSPRGADMRTLEAVGWQPRFTQALFTRFGRY